MEQWHIWAAFVNENGSILDSNKGIDVNKRTVTTQFYNLLQGMRFGHYMTSYAYILFILLD